MIHASAGDHFRSETCWILRWRPDLEAELASSRAPNIWSFKISSHGEKTSSCANAHVRIIRYILFHEVTDRYSFAPSLMHITRQRSLLSLNWTITRQIRKIPFRKHIFPCDPLTIIDSNDNVAHYIFEPRERCQAKLKLDIFPAQGSLGIDESGMN